SDDEAGGTGQRHKGEEGKMGKPTSKSKSGLYALVVRTGAPAGLDEGGERGPERGGAEREDEAGDGGRGGERPSAAGGGDRAEPGREDAREQVQQVRRGEGEAGGDELEGDEEAERVAGAVAAVVQEGRPEREAGE